MRITLGEDPGIEKEEHQRHDHAEEEEHLVAQGKHHAGARQGSEVRQSRSLLPVSSMKTSSSDGVAISRLTSSLFSASRCFTSATIAGAVRWQCRTYVPSTSRTSTTLSRFFSVPLDGGLASRTSIRAL